MSPSGRSVVAFALLTLTALCGVLALEGEEPLQAQRKSETRAETEAMGKDWTRARDFLDETLRAKRKAAKMPLAERCTDAEFIRRAYLDILGRIPSREEVKTWLIPDLTTPEGQEFARLKSHQRREKLIEALLASPEYAESWARTWAITLIGREANATYRNMLQEWLQGQFAQNRPFDKLVYDLVTASGSSENNKAIGYIISFENDRPALTGITSKVFLGKQIQCAQCHKHPYESWTEADFAGMASFFVASNLRVNVRSVPVNPTLVDAPPAPRRAMGDGANLPAEARQRLEEMRKYNAPRVLGGKAVQTQDRSLWRPILAKWMVSPENSQTPRYLANRLWSFVFGSGLLNPVDDFNSFNTPSHPELLEALGRDFAANGWQVKRFFRAALKTQTYQLSSKPAGGKKPEAWHFAHYPVKQLSPEQFMGALVTLAGATDLGRMFKQNSNPYAPIRQRYERLKRGQAEGGENDNMRDYTFDEAALAKFEALFEKVPGDWYMRRVLASRYATSSSDDEMTEGDAFTQTIDQALAVMNGDITNRLSGSGRGSLLGSLMNRFKNEEERLHALYLMTLGRRAGKAESSRMLEYVRSEKDTAKAWEDLLFALLATTEFATNH